ncbi:MAG TPA: hypothetical protein VEP90_12470 [Methylomirabilota bacterium]|nr:hypothetical protein [Methylomirabilota bacterium]
MKSYFDDDFDDFYHQLPPYVKKQATRAFEHFAYDTRYPSLEFKCVNQQKARYAIRINHKGYRALGRVRGDDIYWYWIGPHDDYERRIRD